MSKARQKGTSWETALLEPLRRVFGPQVERAPLKGTADNGDFTGVPYQIEAKSTAKPLFLEWARKANAKSYPWAIVWKGDLRKNDQGPYVLMPFEHFCDLQLRARGSGMAPTVPAAWQTEPADDDAYWASLLATKTTVDL